MSLRITEFLLNNSGSNRTYINVFDIIPKRQKKFFWESIVSWRFAVRHIFQGIVQFTLSWFSFAHQALIVRKFRDMLMSKKFVCSENVLVYGLAPGNLAPFLNLEKIFFFFFPSSYCWDLLPNSYTFSNFIIYFIFL